MGTYTHTEKEIAFVDAMEQDFIGKVKHSKTTVEKKAAKFGIDNKNLIKELTELAICRIARHIARYDLSSVSEKYDKIVELYQNQVNLSQRTSESIRLQQYSTSAPIGYLMGVYVQGETTGLSGNGYKAFRKIAMSDSAFEKKWGVKAGEPDHTQAHPNYASNKKLYFEPSAGNGLLTVALDPKYVYVNELDDIRNANLETLDFAKVTEFDASKNYAIEHNYYRFFDGIITNPPFGSLLAPVNYGENGDKFPIDTLDHLMSLRALDCMKDNGRAAIIIGGHTNWDEHGRIQAGKNRIFFNYLYRYYNVDDVINIDSKKLYSRQGTGFNVRLILINGRKYKAEGVAPLKQSHDTVVHSFDELWDRVMLSMKIMPKQKQVVDLKAQLQEMKQMLMDLKGLSGFEIMRIEKRTTKNENTYYWQEIEYYEHAGSKNNGILWKGKCKKADWDWINEVWNEQPKRRIRKEENYISIEN